MGPGRCGKGTAGGRCLCEVGRRSAKGAGRIFFWWGGGRGGSAGDGFAEVDDPLGGDFEEFLDDVGAGEVVGGGETLDEDGAADDAAVEGEGDVPGHALGVLHVDELGEVGIGEGFADATALGGDPEFVEGVEDDDGGEDALVESEAAGGFDVEFSDGGGVAEGGVGDVGEADAQGEGDDVGEDAEEAGEGEEGGEDAITVGDVGDAADFFGAEVGDLDGGDLVHGHAGGDGGGDAGGDGWDAGRWSGWRGGGRRWGRRLGHGGIMQEGGFAVDKGFG